MVIPVRYNLPLSDDLVISGPEDNYLMTKHLSVRSISDHVRNVDVYLINSDKKVFLVKHHPNSLSYPRTMGPASDFVKIEDLTEDIEDNENCYLNAARKVIEHKLGLEIYDNMLTFIHKISPDKNYKKDWYGVVVVKSDLTPYPHPLHTIPRRCGFYSLSEIDELISNQACADTLKYGFNFKRSKKVIRKELEKLLR